jgi:hypothetical protein
MSGGRLAGLTLMALLADLGQSRRGSSLGEHAIILGNCDIFLPSAWRIPLNLELT